MGGKTEKSIGAIWPDSGYSVSHGFCTGFARRGRLLARDYYNKIIVYHPCAVMCQGEFTLCFQVVELLKQAGIPVLAACSERRVTEKDGKKIVEFEFQQYREY